MIRQEEQVDGQDTAAKFSEEDVKKSLEQAREIMGVHELVPEDGDEERTEEKADTTPHGNEEPTQVEQIHNWHAQDAVGNNPKSSNHGNVCVFSNRLGGLRLLR